MNKANKKIETKREKFDSKSKLGIPILLLLLTYGALFIFFNSLAPLDSQLSLEISKMRTPVLDAFFVLWTNGGSFLFILLVLLVLWLKGERRPAIYLAVGLVADAIFVLALKTIIHQPRPYEVLPITPLELGDTDASLPSGHASRAFLSAVILSKFYRKYTIIFFFLAASIGFSRVYLGVHYPLDILIGAINGVLSGILIINLCDRFGTRRG